MGHFHRHLHDPHPSPLPPAGGGVRVHNRGIVAHLTDFFTRLTWSAADSFI